MKKSEKANKRLDHCEVTSRLLFGAAACSNPGQTELLIPSII